MGTWKLNPEWQSKFQFDALDVANLFVNATSHWYNEEEINGIKQGLYGKAEQVKKVIIDYLEKGECDTNDPSLIYALNKFQREWLGESGSGIFHYIPTLKEFLYTQKWVVYKVDGKTRKFFGDSAFGPMWKDIPQEIEVPADLKLESLGEIERHFRNKL